jgi:hypothetical protein
MKPNVRNTALIAAMLALCALVGLVVACSFEVNPPAPEPCPTCAPYPPFMGYDAEPSGITTFNNLAAGDLALDDDLTVGDDATVTGDLAVTGGSTLSGIAVLGSTSLTQTTGQTLTPVSSVYHIDTAGAITMTLAACTTNGQLLIIYGDDANNITINDTNIRTSTGNAIVVAQYDVAMFVCVDTEWVEMLLITDS